MYMQLYIEHNDSSVVLKKLFVTHIQSTYVSLNAFISWTNKQYTILLHKVEQNIDRSPYRTKICSLQKSW